MTMNLFAPLRSRRDAEELKDVREMSAPLAECLDDDCSLRRKSRQMLARDIVKLFKPG